MTEAEIDAIRRRANEIRGIDPDFHQAVHSLCDTALACLDDTTRLDWLDADPALLRTVKSEDLPLREWVDRLMEDL
jgi:hypothetical protein